MKMRVWSEELACCRDVQLNEMPDQNKGHYAIRGHSRSPILVPMESSFLSVINTNLPPILHRFRDIAFGRSKIAIFGYPSCVLSHRRRGSPETISIKFCVEVRVWLRYRMA